MHSTCRLIVLTAALAMLVAPACTREEPTEELSPALEESGAAGTGVGHGGGGHMMDEPGERPVAGMGMYGEGAHMTLDEMREHMLQVHGRVEHLVDAPHMTGDWAEMGRHMAELDQDMERMIEQMRRLEQDPAATPRLQEMRRHMAVMLRAYDQMVAAMEAPPAADATPTPQG